LKEVVQQRCIYLFFNQKYCKSSAL